MKDFYDLWLMPRQFDFGGARLIEALKRTFKYRKSTLPGHKPIFAEEIYDDKSDRQALWSAFLRKGEIKHAPEKLSKVAQEIEKFLIGPLGAISRGQGYDQEWKAPGPWK